MKVEAMRVDSTALPSVDSAPPNKFPYIDSGSSSRKRFPFLRQPPSPGCRCGQTRRRSYNSHRFGDRGNEFRAGVVAVGEVFRSRHHRPGFRSGGRPQYSTLKEDFHQRMFRRKEILSETTGRPDT